MNKKLRIPLTAAATLALASSTFAADDTWDGDTNALWSDLNNWVGGSVPGSADTATFSSGSPANTTIDLGAGVTIQGIVFAAGPSITIGSGGVNSQTLTRATGGNIFANSGVDHIVNTAIVLGEGGDASTSFTFQNQGITNLLTFAGDITNNGNSQTFNKQGLGTIILSGDNSYGDTLVGNGTLQLDSATALGAGNFVTVRSANAAPAGIDSDVTLDIAGNSISVDRLNLGNTNTASFGPGQTPQVIDSVGGGLITLTNNTAVIYNAGTAANLNGTATISTDLTWASNKTFTVNNGGSDVDLELSGNVIETAGNSVNALITGGSGKLLLSGTDNRDLNTILIRGGTVAFSTDAQLPNTGDIVLGWNATSTTLEYVGTGGSTGNGIDVGRGGTNVTYTGGAIIESNGSGAITFSKGAFNDPIGQDATISRNLTFGGANTGDNTISGVIADNDAGGTINVIKQDAGKWILNGDNTYTGTTSVNAGRLDIGGANTGTGAITVAAGASLGGEGSVAADVTLGSGASAANLHIDGSTVETFTTAGNVDVTNGVIVLLEGYGVGAIDVIGYNTLTGTGGVFDAADFSVSDPLTFRQELFTATTDGTSAGTVQLDLGIKAMTWDNTADNGVWDVNTTGNWNDGAAGQNFFDADYATFDDTGAAGATAGTVTLGSDVIAASVSFVNDTIPYTLDGGGNTLTILDEIIFEGNANATVNAVIAGDGSLTLGDNNDGVSDGANLTLTAANTFTGGVNITEGRLFVFDSAALGTGAVSITDDGANGNAEPVLELDANNLNVANDITITNDGFTKRIRFDIAGTGNTAELSGTLTTLETIDRTVAINAGDGETLTISGKLTGNGVFNAQGGTISLTNDTSDHTGVFMTQAGGVVEITSIADSGVASAAGAGSTVTLGYRNANGTLRYVGDGDSTNRQVRIGEDYTGADRIGAGTIENNGTGALVFTNATFNEVESGAWVGARTLGLGGSNTDANEIQGAIVDNNDTTSDVAVSLIKDGVGTWTLRGANTYTGATTVSAGTLAITAGSSVSPITVSSGAVLGLSIDSTITSTSSLTLDGGSTVSVIGTPTLASYTLITVDGGITGTPVLDAPIVGYELVVDGTSLKLNSTGGAGYSTWASDNGLTLGVNDGETDDPEFDGIENVLEYILGGDPLVADLSILPDGVIDGANYVLTFTRSDESEGDATASVEFGSDLTVFPTTSAAVPAADGTVNGVTFTIIENGADADDVTASIPHGGATEFFGRVNGSLNP